MEHMLALLRTAKELRAGAEGQGQQVQPDDKKANVYVARATEAWRLLSERFADMALPHQPSKGQTRN